MLIPTIMIAAYVGVFVLSAVVVVAKILTVGRSSRQCVAMVGDTLVAESTPARAAANETNHASLAA